jgi:hypothetical protein
MQKTEINKFIPSSEVECSELEAKCRRIFDPDILNIEVDSEFWFGVASRILVQSTRMSSLNFRNTCF